MRSLGKEGRLIHPQYADQQEKTAPNLEAPGPCVALDTPEDPVGTQEACILHSWGHDNTTGPEQAGGARVLAYCA